MNKIELQLKVEKFLFDPVPKKYLGSIVGVKSGVVTVSYTPGI